MASFSTNLLLSLLAQGESNANGFSNWGESANSNFVFLEDALTASSAISITTADVTLSNEQNRSVYLSLSGTLTDDRALIVPARKSFWLVKNGCTGAYDLTVKTSSGSGIVVQQGQTVLLYCNGTNVVKGHDTFSSPVITSVAASGDHTYAKTTKWAVVLLWGAGGGGRNTGAATPRSGPGGGAGGCSIKILTTIPEEGTFVIGAAGTAGSSGGNSTYSDGTVSLAANGGGSGAAVASGVEASGGAGGTATGGDINLTGGAGEPTYANGLAKGGNGGDPPLSIGAAGWSFAADAGAGAYTFMNATGYAAGGAGANNNGSSTARTAGSGAPGFGLVLEFGE